MGRPSPMTWLFYAYCIASAPTYSAQEVWTMLPSWQFSLAATVPQIVTWIAVSFLLLFAVLVPDDGIPRGWRRTAFYVTLVPALATLHSN
jgi:hypothetical protein